MCNYHEDVKRAVEESAKVDTTVPEASQPEPVVVDGAKADITGIAYNPETGESTELTADELDDLLGALFGAPAKDDPERYVLVHGTTGQIAFEYTGERQQAIEFGPSITFTVDTNAAGEPYSLVKFNQALRTLEENTAEGLGIDGVPFDEVTLRGLSVAAKWAADALAEAIKATVVSE